MSLYNNQAWRRKRKAQLDAEPLCRFHKQRGEIVPATVADHIEPHKGDEVKFWHGELQSLCKQCHDSDKQRMEKGGKPKRHYGLDGWPTGGG